MALSSGSNIPTAAPRKSVRIVGGENTNIERYPFMSGILEYFNWGTSQMCGGTLITNRAVVSAAHCFEDLTPSKLRVRLGSTYASSGGQVQEVSRIIMHAQYNKFLLINDVAVIRLQNAVTLSNEIQIARIAGPQYILPDNTPLNVIGWGTTSFHGYPSEILQQASVNIINQSICAERYEDFQSLPIIWPRVTPEMMCTGILDVGGKDACQGDSGGPVVHGGNVLVGITSWGYECAHPVYPAAPRKPERIVGGENTSIERYPFMSGILESSFWGTEQMCGGTLITNRAVVSAAHCFAGFRPSELRVRLGSTYASSGGQVHVLSRIIMHPQYNFRLVLNDVAVTRLQNAATLSNQIQIARIAGPQYILPDNTPLNVIGWGTTSFNGKPSEILQHASVNIINQSLCAERYSYFQSLPGSWPRVTPEMMCTGILDVGGKDACQGDSGGPVIHGGDVLVGITSWGYQCAHPTYPGVNVLVSSYADWIATNAVN
ncbi:unnamed protein product [Danaus chrysippus]|uniref:(African queen) hypothetical protein n=1 Tax=Danaus chrysippus TaxID=151541 RepID=A0A8J2WAS8_9NEOP|nr:unnamed protein product [Danaus chrysippus]